MRETDVEEYLSNSEIRRVQRDLDALTQEETDDNMLTIAFCGIFNSGKSSLINAILKQEFKLPTGGEPVTKYVTRIEYGSKFSAYYFNKNQKVSIDEDTIQQIVRGKVSLPDGCKEIVLQMPAGILEPNVVILDTPGYEDNKTLDEITREAVRSADMAVFCCNADHFGREFEQRYFQELEDSLGNFCVVVNHTDVIHTDEEFVRLEEYVRKMLMGRGKRCLRNIVAKTTFYTVGAGRYADLDGLDICLQTLHDAKGNGWHMLKSYADQKRLRYGLNMISPVVKDNIQKGAKLCKDLEDEMRVAYDDLMYQYQVECRDVEKAVSSLRRFIYDLLDAKTGIVQGKLEALEKEGKYRDFVQMASQILCNCYRSLPDDIRVWKQKQPLFKNKNLGTLALASDLANEVEQYNIPAPVGKRVKNRGLLEALAVSAVMSLSLLVPYHDDGYDIEYHGYADEAVKSIKNKLLPKIDRIIDSYIQKQREAFMPPRPELDTEILKKVCGRIEEWQEIDQKIDYYISNLAEIDVQSERKSIVIVGGFASGKTTLINALTKSDFFATGPLPMGKIPTVLRSVDADNKEKIICAYASQAGEYYYEEISSKWLNEAFIIQGIEDLDYQSQIKQPEYITIYSEKIPENYQYVDLPSNIIMGMYSEKYSEIEFLEKADVILYTVDSCRPLTNEDMRFIERLKAWHLENIFFAVTRINVLSDSDRLSLEKFLRDRLSFMFLNSRAEFDENLYNNRVFFVDAYSSMNTRLGRATQIDRNYEVMVPDQTTGMPDLERALYNYL